MVCSLRLGVGGDPVSPPPQTTAVLSLCLPRGCSGGPSPSLLSTPRREPAEVPAVCTLLYVLAPLQCPPIPACARGALSLSSTLSALAHPQPADTAWKSLPWFPWKLGAKNHFQGHVSHSDKATLVHTNPLGRPGVDPTPGREGSQSLRKEEQKTDCGRNQRGWLQRDNLEHPHVSEEPWAFTAPGGSDLSPSERSWVGLCGSERKGPYAGSANYTWRLCCPQLLTPDWELGLKPERELKLLFTSTPKNSCLKEDENHWACILSCWVPSVCPVPEAQLSWKAGGIE